MIKTADLIAKFQKAEHDKWGYIWGTAGVKWTEEKQAELEKTTDPDRAQGREYGMKWIGHVVADCSGLFSWAFKQLGGQMYHGSNTMYLKWCSNKGKLNKGKREDGKTLKPGTAVFVWNGNNYSHVGLFVGNGQVIEARSTKLGVVFSKVTDNRWSHWGELKGVDYSAKTADSTPSSTPADKSSLPTLKRGNKGEYVTLLQTELVNRGYDIGSYGIDGDFGKCTEAAVKQFQRDNGLDADGIVGQKTWDALERQDKALYTVVIQHLTRSKAESIIKAYGGIVEEERG